MNCPCKECICIPMCRHMHFIDMRMKCELISEYLFERYTYIKKDDYQLRIESVSGFINPTKWTYLIQQKNALPGLKVVDASKESVVDTRVDNSGNYYVKELEP